MSNTVRTAYRTISHAIAWHNPIYAFRLQRMLLIRRSAIQTLITTVSPRAGQRPAAYYNGTMRDCQRRRLRTRSVACDENRSDVLGSPSILGCDDSRRDIGAIALRAVELQRCDKIVSLLTLR